MGSGHSHFFQYGWKNIWHFFKPIDDKLACILDFRPLAYVKNLFEGTKKALLETVTRYVAFSGEGLFRRISNTSLELV